MKLMIMWLLSLKCAATGYTESTLARWPSVELCRPRVNQSRNLHKAGKGVAVAL